MSSLSPSSSSHDFPPGFSPIALAATPPPPLEDGEIPLSAGRAPKVGLVPEFKPGWSRDAPSKAGNSVVSLFIDYIPTGKNSAWLFHTFKEFGRIVDIYIPGHKSRASKMHYGFVRFESKTAASLAISRLDGSLAENNRLVVREARFAKARGFGRGFQPQPKSVPSVCPQNPSGGLICDGGISASIRHKSYAQVVAGSGLVNEPEISPSVNLKVRGLASSVDWLSRCAVATANCTVDLGGLSSCLLSGLKGLQKIFSWGGRKLLLLFQRSEELGDAIAGSAWRSCLSSLSQWDGQLVNKSRLTWISCISMPLSAWNVGTFNRIAQLWGSLVAVEEGSLNLSDCYTARLLIETDFSQVGGIIEVSIEGSLFKVVVREESGGEFFSPWPECSTAISPEAEVCCVAAFHIARPKAYSNWEIDSDKSGIPRVPTAHQKMFKLWRISETRFNFRLHDKKFLGLDTDKNGSPFVSHSSKSAGTSETFEISRHHHNPTQIRIKASNGFYLQVNEEHVTADCEGNSDWGNDDPSVFLIESVRQLDGEYQVTNGYGPLLAPKVMRDHWNTFITEEDFKFMSRNGINTVRIPVGWWIAKGPNPPAPYVGGSLQHLDNAFSWALKYQMKVIVDLHAAPGSQTASTVSSSRDGFMEWGETDENIQETVAVIDFLTARYAKHPSLYAVELLNEPLFPDISLEKLTKYYRAGYYAVRNHSNAYVLFSNRLGRNPADPRELLPLSTELKGSVIDVHHYQYFMEIFKTMNLQQTIDYLYTNVSAELNHLITPKGPLVFVGEWATDWATAKFMNAGKENYQNFSKAQLEVYGRATFGWAYWTLKCKLKHFSLEWMINNGYIDRHSITGISSDAYSTSDNVAINFSKLMANLLKLKDTRILTLLNLIFHVLVGTMTFIFVSDS